MTNSAQHRSWALNLRSWPATAALATIILFALLVAFIPAARAQTYRVIHDFTGGADGLRPLATLTLDRAGNLYGTSAGGGSGGHGLKTEP